MASPERKAWKIYRDLDVKYVFVVFGGYIGWVSTLFVFCDEGFRALLCLTCCMPTTLQLSSSPDSDFLAVAYFTHSSCHHQLKIMCPASIMQRSLAASSVKMLYYMTCCLITLLGLLQCMAIYTKVRICEVAFPLCSYPSDDINKFLWMVRIGGGVFPEIKEKDYLGNGNYRVDAEAGKASSPY